MESKLLKFSVLILTIMFLMLGCSPFKPQVRKSPEGELPQAYSIGVDTHDPSQRWWEEFNDPELNRLVQQALSGNFTLKEAWARLKQANASAVQVRSALIRI